MPRSKLDIFAQVLEMAKNGTTKTRVVSQANLNQKLATYLLSLLVNLDLLAEKHNSPVSYCTTEKGFRFLNEYRRIQKLLLEF
jgi:predicted transcriptional regulator